MIEQGHKGSPWLGWKLNSGHWSKVDKKKGKGKGRETQEAVAFIGGKALGPWGFLQTAWESASCQKYQLTMLAFLFHCKEICGQDLVSKPQQKTRRKTKTNPKFTWQEKH